MTTPAASPRVVVVHDYATQRGGAERVALAMLRTFPGSRLITSSYNRARTYGEFEDYDVETLWTQKVPLFRSDPRRALPFLARAFSEHRVEDADVLMCSTSGWAHGIGGDLPKVVYCHNPARWLYQVDDYFGDRHPALARGFARVSDRLKHWDHRSAGGASMYFANSNTVRHRIASAYGIDAEFLPPPPGVEPGGDQQPVEGVEPGFLLTVSRARGYKNTELICRAAESMPGVRLVVVGGLPKGSWSSRLTGLRGISDAQLAWLYAHSAGLVAVGREDFGLTPVESYSFGRPAAVLQAGGYVDSADPEVATAWIELPNLDDVVAGMSELFERSWDSGAIRRHAERFSLSSFQSRLVRACDSVFTQPRSTRRVTDLRQLQRPRERWDIRGGALNQSDTSTKSDTSTRGAGVHRGSRDVETG